MFPNNSSCWYASACGFIEVLKTIYGTGTKSTKLITFLICPISMCQTLTLAVGQLYYLSFDVTSLPLVNVAMANAYINGRLLVSVVHRDYRQVTNAYIEFIANSTSNKICFNGSASLIPGSNTFHNDYTPILDNFILDVVTPRSSTNLSEIINITTTNWSNNITVN